MSSGEVLLHWCTWIPSRYEFRVEVIVKIASVNIRARMLSVQH